MFARRILFVMLFVLTIVLVVLVSLDVFTKDKIAELVITAVATAIAAWAGGAAAFEVERNSLVAERRRKEIGAANKAIFKIDQIYTVLRNVYDQSITPHRDAPDRALSMTSPHPGVLPVVTFHFDELDFLLEPGRPGPMILRDLLLLEWRYGVVLECVSQRASLSSRLYDGGPTVRDELEEWTEQFITNVESGLTESGDTYRRLHKVLAVLYPGQKFLTVEVLGNNQGAK